MLKLYYADISALGGRELLHKAGRYILERAVPGRRIITGKNGKPYFEDSDIYFNISHSYPYVVCAVSDCCVGVDVEKIRAVSERAAERVFTDSEKLRLERGTPFLSLWTLKESVVKAYGGSIVDDCKSFDVSEQSCCVYKGVKYYLKKASLPQCACHIATVCESDEPEIIKVTIKKGSF